MHIRRIREFIASLSLIDILLLKRLSRDNIEISLDDNNRLQYNDRIITSTSFNDNTKFSINPFTSNVLVEGADCNVSKIVIDEDNNRRTITINTIEGQLTLMKRDELTYIGMLDNVCDIIIVNLGGDVIIVNNAINNVYVGCVTSSGKLVINKTTMDIEGYVPSIRIREKMDALLNMLFNPNQ